MSGEAHPGPELAPVATAGGDRQAGLMRLPALLVDTGLLWQATGA